MPPYGTIVSIGGWFGSSVVFQDNAIGHVLEKVFVIGWRKEILWTRDYEGPH